MSETKKQEQGSRKTLVGTVVGDKMDKTVIVQVTRRLMHPKYKKFVSSRTKYKAHDERNECHEGDRVLIVESRPMSREKRWRVRETLERAAGR